MLRTDCLKTATYLQFAEGRTEFRHHDLLWVVADVQWLSEPALIPHDSSLSWTTITRLRATPQIGKLLLDDRFGIVYYAIRIHLDLVEMLKRSEIDVLSTPMASATVVKLQVPMASADHDDGPEPAVDRQAAANIRLRTTFPHKTKLTEYAFTTDTIVNALQLRWQLAGTHIEVLSVCERVWRLSLQPQVAKQLLDATTSNEFCLPSRPVLDAAMRKLDIMLTSWHAEEMKTHHSRRFLIPDSGPQAGFNILCLIEDRLVWPANMCSSDLINKPLESQLQQ